MTVPILFAVLFFAVMAVFAVKSRIGEKMSPGPKAGIVILLGAALAVRLMLGYFTVGFESDVTTFKAWGLLANQVGYGEVYNQNVFLDYPPGYLYLLSFLDLIRTGLGIDIYSNTYTLMIKLPSILADLVCGYFIYSLAKRRLDGGNSLFLSAAYLFCPAVLVNSAVWGQADSFTTALLFGSLLFLFRDKIAPAALLYGLGVISKPQVLIFAPVFLFYTIFKKNWKGLVLGLVCGFGVILLVATPFIKDFNYFWLVGKYKETMDFYAYYSINAYNFWALLGMNWVSLPTEGIGLFVLNWAGPALAVVLCGLLMFFARRKDVIFACPALLMATVYLFSVKMHERYLFPALLFLLVPYIFTRDRRFLWLFGGFSAVHYLNVRYILFLQNAYVDPFAPEVVALSAAHLILYGAMLYVLYSVYVGEKVKENFLVNSFRKTDAAGRPAPFLTETMDRRFTVKDLAVVGAITLVYGVVAFWNLGSTVTANTSWCPQNGESVILKTEGEYDSVTFLPGIAADVSPEQRYYRVGTNIRIETSDDGVTWQLAAEISDADGSHAVYEWENLSLNSQGNYIRITSTGENTTINEVAFRSGGVSGFVPVTLESGSGEALIDEQETVPLYPSWENSTYFDEIYHARTAYEHILGVAPYENTHPTLGKLIISLGIRMFGMNPFGWRFMGTLFGVLMLPLLYHLLKRLFGRRLFCAGGTLLFAFDFMHYTQTRIATIDTYAVFFILLMYDAMIVFVQKDLEKAKTGELLLPLGLCGLFMGLGISSKWTVAYAAVGLAVLFFGKLIVSRIRLGAALPARVPVSLCLWCLLFFILIPFGIYFLAFLPVTTLPQNSHDVWGSFWNCQVSMFEYHSQLQATHYFASPWYEWPLDIRNIWYYGNTNVDGSGTASTIVCLGNPLLWWGGLAAILYAFFVALYRKNQNAAILSVGFLSAYLPWVLVPRLTFVYHYFTAVPFLVGAILLFFSTQTRWQKPVGKKGVLALLSVRDLIFGVYVVLCLILFLVFFPAISGAGSSEAYLNSLEWLPNWYFI